MQPAVGCAQPPTAGIDRDSRQRHSGPRACGSANHRQAPDQGGLSEETRRPGEPGLGRGVGIPQSAYDMEFGELTGVAAATQGIGHGKANLPGTLAPAAIEHWRSVLAWVTSISSTGC